MLFFVKNISANNFKSVNKMSFFTKQMAFLKEVSKQTNLLSSHKF